MIKLKIKIKLKILGLLCQISCLDHKIIDNLMKKNNKIIFSKRTIMM